MLGDYAGASSAEVVGRDGRRVVVAPLFDWHPDTYGADNDRWEYALRGTDGLLVPRPDGDDTWGCPDIWDVSFAGLRLDQGMWDLEQMMALAGALAGWEPTTTEAATQVGLGQPATEYAVDPYPGRRPTGSWVIDVDGRCWPVQPDDALPSGWAVHSRDRRRLPGLLARGQGSRTTGRTGAPVELWLERVPRQGPRQRHRPPSREPGLRDGGTRLGLVRR